MLFDMKAIAIHVENGKISGDAPAGLPDGDFELALVQPPDDLTDDEFAKVEAVLLRGVEAVRVGATQDAADVAARLLRR
jgi:hypothetical protein